MSAMPQPNAAKPAQAPGPICLDCGVADATPPYRYCRACLSERRRRSALKREYTPFIDATLRRIYHERLEKKTSRIPGLAEFARRLGWPVSTLRYRASVLGLSRQRSKPQEWTEEELAILTKYAWATADRIRVHLSLAGFARSVNAIRIKRLREGCEDAAGVYSANSLAECFGVDSHAIGKWIRLGYLKAERRGTERMRDIYAIHRKDVRAFVRKYPNEFDIRKVCQPWFMDLVFDGRICRSRA